MDKYKEEFIESHKIRLEKAREKAKEKAIELVEKFKNRSIELGQSHSQLLAEANALIAVDEIIKSLRKILPEVGLGKGFWYNVREEIKNL